MGAPDQPRATPPAPGNPPSPQSGPRTAEVSPETRILSILHAKDQEEIKVGQLAQRQASSEPARQFGNMLVSDHSDHDKEVQAAAAAANVALLDSQEVQRLLQREKAAATPDPDPIAELQNLQGADFDKKLGQVMVQGHKDLIAIVEAARANVQDPSVKALLDKTLPVLHHHEEAAQALVAGT